MSTSEFTITLGRTGQVVKRKRGDSDVARSESLQSAARRHKRGVGGGGNPLSFDSKRQRIDDGRRVLSRDGNKDVGLDHRDLRYKLLHKRSSGLAISHRAGANVQKRSDIQGDVPAPPDRSSINSNIPWSVPEFRRNSQAMQFSARDSTRDSLCMDSPRNYYSSLTTNDSRGRSPARPLITSRSISPPTYAEFRGVSSMGPNVTSGAQHVLRNEVHDPHRLVQPPSMIDHSAMISRPAAPFPPPNGTLQRSLCLGETSLSVPGLLSSLGLAKYAIHFQAEEVDMTALKQMCDEDLKDIGIPMGPRKKILQAVMAISKRPPLAPPLPPRQL